ncbi:hypothetical protein CDAR_49251 [Caerostris darwini]|uniref:Uncharacterized protein n=1 Tax=Caerostris darwini TaxID=1538125 RepID=A0AAV4QA40_9ARAC|nr:hypothetical protein CDAR_49251 [Caerostris darwini]
MPLSSELLSVRKIIIPTCLSPKEKRLPQLISNYSNHIPKLDVSMEPEQSCIFKNTSQADDLEGVPHVPSISFVFGTRNEPCMNYLLNDHETPFLIPLPYSINFLFTSIDLQRNIFSLHLDVNWIGVYRGLEIVVLFWIDGGGGSMRL